MWGVSHRYAFEDVAWILPTNGESVLACLVGWRLIYVCNSSMSQRPFGVPPMRFLRKFSKFSLAHAAICAVIALPLLPAHAQNASIDAPKQGKHGIAVANMRASVKPGDDFYRYANGAGLERTELPPDPGSVGVFNTLADLSNT